MMKIEVWRDTVGYEGIYQVSDLGNVKSLKFGKEKILKPSKDKKGYRHVVLCKNGIRKPVKVYPLVAKAFPEICGEYFKGAEVDHIIPVSMGGTDEATNLRVCTTKENHNNPITKQNMSEAHKGKFGAEHPKSKPVLQYSKDGEFIKEWAGMCEVERELGINQGSISFCCRGKKKSAGGYIWKYKEVG